MLLKTKSLPSDVLHIISNKSTEHPFTGEYNNFDQIGTYLCRQCGLALFRSNSKFVAACGWPSFDAEIPGAVKKQRDSDNVRTEILCTRCNGHLGHIFQGESYTEKNTRYCVNSLSLDFVTNKNIKDTKDTEEAIFAAGCFWGVEYFFKKLPGVLKTEVGYTGGHTDFPSYEEVCTGNTGHVESIRVIYDSEKISYDDLVRYFFEIHDPTQENGQGPDIGAQYLSIIFYYNDAQKNTAQTLIHQLQEKNYRIVTKVLPVSIFQRAETYHQDYYEKMGKTPYCHVYIKRFD